MATLADSSWYGYVAPNPNFDFLIVRFLPIGNQLADHRPY